MVSDDVSVRADVCVGGDQGTGGVMETVTVGTVMVVVGGGLMLAMGPGVMLVTILGGICSMVRGDA